MCHQQIAYLRYGFCQHFQGDCYNQSPVEIHILITAITVNFNNPLNDAPIFQVSTGIGSEFVIAKNYVHALTCLCTSKFFSLDKLFKSTGGNKISPKGIKPKIFTILIIPFLECGTVFCRYDFTLVTWSEP